MNLSGGIQTGNLFELVWFDPDGLHAGVLTDPSFVLPADGRYGLYDSFFYGVDPVRPADKLIVVPEPGSLALGILGTATVLRRRRR